MAQFFPIWLEKAVGLSPVQLSGVSAGQFLCIALVVTCAQRLSRRAGRVQVMLGVKFLSFCVFTAIIVGDGMSCVCALRVSTCVSRAH